MEKTILDRWQVTAEELTQIIDQNPSLRGMILGYLAELKLEQLWLTGDKIEVAVQGPATPGNLLKRYAPEFS
jgi:hypothetical protein